MSDIAIGILIGALGMLALIWVGSMCRAASNEPLDAPNGREFRDFDCHEND